MQFFSKKKLPRKLVPVKISTIKVYDLLFQVICHFWTFFYPTRFVVLVCFSGSLAGLTLFKLHFLNPFSMYTTGTKINTEAFILILQCTTPSYIPNFKLGNVTKVFVGIRSQIVPLKLSFAFCVLSYNYFSNSVSLLSSKSICRHYLIMSFGRPGPGV